MLVLARGENQRIRIGSDITVTILEISGRVIRVGVDAPEDIVVLREELLETADETVRDAEGV